MIKTGYKLTTKFIDGSETSLTNGYSSDVFYKKYHWTYPRANCGPLAVFDTLENAAREIENFNKPEFGGAMTICHKCEYIPAIGEISLWVIDYTKISPIEEMTKVVYLPRGTVLAAAVRLLD